MQLNNKKLERTSRFIYYTISVVLCLFLILLSDTVIGDLEGAATWPELEAYQNKATLQRLERERTTEEYVHEGLKNQHTSIEKVLETVRQNAQHEKVSFDTWLQTRKTLGAPDQDHEVLARARRLDTLHSVEQKWLAQRDSVMNAQYKVSERLTAIQQRVDAENERAGRKHQAAVQRYELKVFLIRLLFVGPVLALGVWFFIRYRRHRFWPLFFGFTLFSGYAFFVGLAPYLPSYGGYVRYTVGVALSAGLGYYAIKSIRKYVETKKAELNASAQERARLVQTEVAEKALEHHICPSCGKDFMLKQWESAAGEALAKVSSFCRHCGLELFRACRRCGARNFAHLPYCAVCGESTNNAG